VGLGDTTHDQRSLTRPFDFSGKTNAVGGDGSDIGAFELQPACAEQAVSPTVVCPAPSSGDGGGTTTTPPAPGPGPSPTPAAKKRCKHGKKASAAKKKCKKHKK
jgi:hypothetical protein